MSARDMRDRTTKGPGYRFAHPGYACFGSCDQGFCEIFLANQFNPFPLHRKATSKDWYVRPESIP
ncbi:hypothetical protein CQ12_03935 [Bradyrhizobium jicamae]|uniref:Uncharacterized protein n=1 Tax=Bradyrhizobium jicamae TaxID=280332 RepID=A0A0R3KIW6_9BRAD|nr:hypothetical protein [Bradyrhizobium jicamae]KRQ95735.1 hypothetical protein CQ12_03935 [Bradyrhizobium jicamae]